MCHDALMLTKLNAINNCAIVFVIKEHGMKINSLFRL